MRKTIRFILFTIYIIVIFALVVLLSWELYGKEYIENYIDKNYGNAIIQTNEDLNILKNSEPFISDDESTN